MAIGVTITGVDERTSFAELIELQRQYPQLEFAVLVGSRVSPRFPKLEIVQQVASLPRSALHLCGPYVREVLVYGTVPMSVRQAFNRIQINMVKMPNDIAPLHRFIASQPCESIILPLRGTRGDQRLLPRPNVEYLYDTSGGRGIDTIDTWPVPPTRERVGYAGGIGPDTIDRAMEFARKYPYAYLWFDMESGVRDEDDWLDLDKVRKVLAKVYHDLPDFKYTGGV